MPRRGVRESYLRPPVDKKDRHAQPGQNLFERQARHFRVDEADAEPECILYVPAKLGDQRQLIVIVRWPDRKALHTESREHSDIRRDPHASEPLQPVLRQKGGIEGQCLDFGIGHDIALGHGCAGDRVPTLYRARHADILLPPAVALVVVLRGLHPRRNDGREAAILALVDEDSADVIEDVRNPLQRVWPHRRSERGAVDRLDCDDEAPAVFCHQDFPRLPLSARLTQPSRENVSKCS